MTKFRELLPHKVALAASDYKHRVLMLRYKRVVSLITVVVLLTMQLLPLVQPVLAAPSPKPATAESAGLVLAPEPQPVYTVPEKPAVSMPAEPMCGPNTVSSSAVLPAAALQQEEEASEEEPVEITDAGGHYRFVGLPHGSHRVTIDLATLPPDLQPSGDATPPVVWVTPGTMQTSSALANGVRFTAVYERDSGDIHGFVFVDADDDGVFDADERGLPDVLVIDPTAHQYFVPFYDVDLWDLLSEKRDCHTNASALSVGTKLDSSIFLVSSYDGTIYYYDHWEDGYDPDPLVPGSTTEVGVLDAGASKVFTGLFNKTQIADPNIFLYDGRDRITVFGEEVSVTRLVYPEGQTVLAGAWELLEVADWGDDYITTVGEDLNTDSGRGDDHNFAGMEVMAALPGTEVYYAGTYLDTLDAGEAYLINGVGSNDVPGGGGGITSTASITATAPIQVQLVTGGCADANSAHGYTLQPLSAWGNDYWAPVPGFDCTSTQDRGHDADIYLHNPHSYKITVTVESSGTIDMPIPANSTRSILQYASSSPHNWDDISDGTSGVHLYSDDTFWGVGVIDSSSDVDGNDDGDGSREYDWGYSLVPVSQLSAQVVVGYAPGSGNMSQYTPNNGNVAFVTAVTDTIVYVDLNQDGLPDPFDMNSNDDAVDNDVYSNPDWDEPLSALGIPLDAGESLRVGDPNDYNLEGALIYTENYLQKIAVAWGQDMCVANPAQDYLDLGYTVLPLPVPTLSKWDELADDVDQSGDVSPGDTITYVISFNNNGLGSLNDVVLTDTLPYTYSDFVEGSLNVSTPPATDTIAYYDGATWTATPISRAHMFTITWPTMGPGQEVTITFNARLHTDIPLTVTHITNQAFVNAANLDEPRASEDPADPFDPDTDTPIGRPELTIAKSASATTVEPGDTITYTVTVTNFGTGIAIDTLIEDLLPAGMTYVTDSMYMKWPLPYKQVITRPVTRTAFFSGYYADDFDLDATNSTHYTGSDGTLDWSTDWTEQGDDDDPDTGQIRVIANSTYAASDPGYLEFTDSDGNTESLTRTLDLTQFSEPWLRYYISGTGTTGENYNVLLNADSTFIAKDYEGYYTLEEEDISSAAGAAATLGFAAEGTLDSGDSYRFDHIAIFERDTERTVDDIVSWEETQYVTKTGSNPASYDAATGRLVFTDALRLPAGSAVKITYQAQMTSPLTNNVSLTNTASVTSPNWLNVTKPPTTSHSINVNSSHTLNLDKTGAPDTVVFGELITYTLAYTATGNSPVPNAVITDAVPTGTVFVAATGGQSVSSPAIGGTGIVTWTLGTLLPAASGLAEQSGVVTLTVRVSTGASDPIENRARLSDDTDESDTSTTTTNYIPSGIVEGTIYIDVDGDGVYSPTVDTPLSGVDIVITDTNGSTYTVTTNANGTYSLTIPAGDATVDVDDDTLPPNVELASGSDDPVDITIQEGDTTENDVGYVYDQYVEGQLYIDVDGDGVYDSGVDIPLRDVDVVITDTNGLTYTVTTDANGYYSQTVPAGSTTVDANEHDPDMPAGLTLAPGSSDPTTVNVPANSTAVDDNVYMYNQYVEGTLYVDVDGDGIYSPTVDTPLTGVDVVITDTHGMVYTVTTDANGYYSQTVPAGAVVVDVDDSDLPPDVILSSGSNDPVTVTVPVDGSETNDVGYLQISTFTGTVYDDVNGNGIQDPGEAPLESVEVTLIDPGPDGLFNTSDDISTTTQTDSNGVYTFTDVIVGDYIIEETDPDGYTSTTNNTIPTTLAPGVTGIVNFGDQQVSTISGVVFDDVDGDGIQGPNETGISGTVISLVNPFTNEVIVTTTTGLDGSYTFTDVEAGPYYVVETDPDTYASTTPNTMPISVAPGGAETANFGDHKAGTVSGLVFEDADGDGVQGPDEPGLEGVVVSLIITETGEVVTVTTNSNGSYVFTDVAPGTYVVQETDPAGYASTTPNAVPVTVDPDGAATVGFGDLPVGTVSGVVFNDINGDGSKSVGENMLGGVTIELLDDTGTVIATTTTDARGTYTFTNIPSGTYTAREIDPDGFVSTTDNEVPIIITTGGAATANFGDQMSATVSGVVFNDMNGDGVLDSGEEGIGGVTITLRNLTTGELVTVTTAGDGSYIFAGITPGEYEVVEIDPEGFASTTPNIVQITVAAGASSTAIFGDWLVLLCDTPVDDYEPDSLYTQSDEIATDGTQITRTFHVLSDKDWVKFYAWAGRTYTITTSHLDADTDTVIQLYDVDGATLLKENDDYTPDSDASQIVWTMANSGWHYIRITHFDRTYDPRYSEVCGNGYRVAVELAPCDVELDPHEPDNLYTEATKVPADGTPLRRTFEMMADKDWVRFDAVAGRVYTITTSQLGAALDTVIQLYGQDGGTLLAENDDYMPESDASRIVWVAPKDGTYFVRVAHFDRTYDPDTAPVCGNGYLVSVETPLCDLDDGYEPDDYYQDAVWIPTTGQVFTHTFDMKGDKDWLSFQARAGQIYTLTTSNLAHDVDTVLHLYDVDGETELAQNDDYLAGSRASRIKWVAPRSGLYYVRVTHFDHTYDPRYALVCGSMYAISVDQEILGLTKVADTGGKDELSPGNLITYTILVWNKMNSVQEGVIITDYIPLHTAYITNSAHTTLGTIKGPDPLVIDVNNLAPGRAVTVTFTVALLESAQGQTIVNQALVSSEQLGAKSYTPIVVVHTKYYLYIPLITRRYRYSVKGESY